LTSDDLEELKKVQVLIEKTKEITLHLPEQTYDEFNRNRETKIADALKKLREEKLNNLFPQISKEYPEYKKMRDAIKLFDESKSSLLEKLNTDITTYALEADKIIYKLFEKAVFYSTTEALLTNAKTRYDLGKPPGKNKSYGDALNWETLLGNVPDGEDLYFVSEDKDYYSEINPATFNYYLYQEWKNKKKSDIYSFKRMSEFFKAKFPKIKLASDYEKEILIRDLSASGSFAKSRLILYKLSEFEDFSSTELNDIVFACTTNSQIYWIRNDADIQKIITDIIKPNRDKIDPAYLPDFDKLYDYAK